MHLLEGEKTRNYGLEVHFKLHGTVQVRRLSLGLQVVVQKVLIRQSPERLPNKGFFLETRTKLAWSGFHLSVMHTCCRRAAGPWLQAWSL